MPLCLCGKILFTRRGTSCTLPFSERTNLPPRLAGSAQDDRIKNRDTSYIFFHFHSNKGHSGRSCPISLKWGLHILRFAWRAQRRTIASRTVTLLIFFSTSTVTRVIPADLGLVPADLLNLHGGWTADPLGLPILRARGDSRGNRVLAHHRRLGRGRLRLGHRQAGIKSGCSSLIWWACCFRKSSSLGSTFSMRKRSLRDSSFTLPTRS